LTTSFSRKENGRKWEEGKKMATEERGRGMRRDDRMKSFRIN